MAGLSLKEESCSCISPDGGMSLAEPDVNIERKRPVLLAGMEEKSLVAGLEGGMSHVLVAEMLKSGA